MVSVAHRSGAEVAKSFHDMSKRSNRQNKRRRAMIEFHGLEFVS